MFADYITLTPYAKMLDVRPCCDKIGCAKKINTKIFSENIKPFHFLVQNDPLTNNYTRLKSPLVCDNAKTHSGTGVYVCSHTAAAD